MRRAHPNFEQKNRLTSGLALDQFVSTFLWQPLVFLFNVQTIIHQSDFVESDAEEVPFQKYDRVHIPLLVNHLSSTKGIGACYFYLSRPLGVRKVKSCVRLEGFFASEKRRRIVCSNRVWTFKECVW